MAFGKKLPGTSLTSLMRGHSVGRARGGFRLNSLSGKMRKMSSKGGFRKFSLSDILPRKKF